MAEKANIKIQYTPIILSTIGAVGILAVGLVAPNAVQMFGPILKKKKNYDPAYYIRKKIKNLEEKGLVKIFTENGRAVVRLTNKGEKQLDWHRTKEREIKEKWDGHYRLVAFDVPEHRRGIRNKLRKELLDFGFVQLQRSIWLYPYDCQEFVDLLKADLHIGKDVLIIKANNIENDWWIRRAFQLPQPS